MDSVTSFLGNWWRKPLDLNGDALDWFLTFGLVVVGFFLWGRIVNKIA